MGADDNPFAASPSADLEARAVVGERIRAGPLVELRCDGGCIEAVVVEELN